MVDSVCPVIHHGNGMQTGLHILRVKHCSHSFASNVLRLRKTASTSIFSLDVYYVTGSVLT